jgi:hypothetical protein
MSDNYFEESTAALGTIVTIVLIVLIALMVGFG